MNIKKSFQDLETLVKHRMKLTAWISPCHHPVSVFFLTKIICPRWSVSCSFPVAV
jgi:hypothetical protein